MIDEVQTDITLDLQSRFGGQLTLQATRDGIPTLWANRGQIPEILRYLKTEKTHSFRTLYDLAAIDERTRTHREGQPPSDFTIVYHLFSFERNQDLRIKVPLLGEYPSMTSVTDIYPSANWYEREAWDMFGIHFEGHPDLRRILLPPWWQGHPLRKEHPNRATEMGPFHMPEDKEVADQEMLAFHPEKYGIQPGDEDSEYMFLNVGPQHPGTHGLLRVILALDGEEIVEAIPDIGFHHRGQEKIGERQSWHTYIPYTDRVEYLSGVNNNQPYLMAVEKLAGIQVPQRAEVIRVMLCELFRLSSHLVWFGTFAQDLGALSPVFYMFTDREKIFDIIEAVCGARMHPNWFRIGGVAQDLPKGWDRLVADFIKYFTPHLKEYEDMVVKNRIFKERTVGVGSFSVDEAIEWGVTGPALRACGMAWDFRKKQPYSSYDQFDFEIPTAVHGDCFDRALVRVAELRQSTRIIQQCLQNMPAGEYMSDHPLATPPRKERTMHDIETLITHFLNVSWGPVIPPGEAGAHVEAPKGEYGYYLVSDGGTIPYRVRIRAPSFAHMQMLPLITRGLMIPDLLAVLGAMDYVLSDIDR
jgi:NADH-quinone oxidoreductase subunit C/D